MGDDHNFHKACWCLKAHKKSEYYMRLEKELSAERRKIISGPQTTDRRQLKLPIDWWGLNNFDKAAWMKGPQKENVQKEEDAKGET